VSSRPETPPRPTQNLSSRPEASHRDAVAETPAFGTTTNPVILSEVAQAAKAKDPEGPGPAAAARPFSTTNHTTDGSLALAPEPNPKTEDRPQLVPQPLGATVDPDTRQSALVSALAAVKGQQSASDAIHDATLTLSGDTLQIQTTVSKPMLPTLFNAEATRILTATLRHSHPNLKLALLPGAPASAAPKKKRAAATGSAAELAENHPMVQEAKRLFSAEISNVIDLRDKE
jgi:DNA polymerase-3 subunit gamma/tau